MGFALFVLLNLVQILMPSAFVRDLEAVPIYLFVLLGCLVASYPGVLAQLHPASLAGRPISVCVLGLLVAVELSFLSHAHFLYARTLGPEFAKLVLYYLLLVANINSPARLRRFLTCIASFVGLLTLLALLQYHGQIDIESLRSLERGDDVGLGLGTFHQLKANGVFDDPNDFCLVLMLSMAVCLYRLNDPAGSVFRIAWLIPLATFGYAFALTRSRGGFLGVLLALATFLYARFGLKKALPLAAVALPMMFVLFAGRQTSLSTGGGTAQARIQIWVEGITLFRQSPLFGIGFNQFVGVVGIEAHNSFLHTFADLGFFGGTLFLGIFVFALRALNLLGSNRTRLLDPDLRRLRPYLMAIVAGYFGGMMSISRAYIIPTYMIAGLITVFLQCTMIWPPLPSLRFNARLVQRMAITGVIFMVSIYFYTRFSARWGGG